MKDFVLKKKMYYHDTDSGGVVYYSNYLKYFEEARTEHLLSIGIDIKELIKRHIFFVVANLEIKYKSPAVYGDTLGIISKIEKIGSASLNFRHEARRYEKILVECKTTLVLVNANLKPTPLPQDILVFLIGK